MLRCRWFLGIGLAVSTGLVAGCHSVASHPSASMQASTEPGTEPPQKEPTRAATQKISQAHAHYAAAVIHEMNDDQDAALEEYYLAALDDPDNEQLILEVSRRFTQKKQPEKALELLTRATARPSASGNLYAYLGFVYAQLGKREQAMAANRAAIKKAPHSLVGYQNLFLNLVQNQQPQEAIKILDEAAHQTDTDPDFLINLAELYSNSGVQVPKQKDVAKAKALAVLKRAEKLNPSNPALKLKLADGFNLLGESGKAADLYLDLLKKLPDLPLIRERVRAKLTDIYLRSSERGAAIEQLEAILREDPTNGQACYSLGSIFYDEKRFAEAAEHFSRTIVLSPDFEPAYYDLASSQMSLNKTSDALVTLDKARRRFPQSFVLEFLSGMAFNHEKAYSEAIQHFTAAEVIAQATDPKRLNHVFYFQLGAAHERKGEYAQAEKYFDKCLQLSPDFAEALNYLGYMWAERGTNLEKARDLIEKAVKIEPQNAAYLDSLGWVLFKLNQPQEALQYLIKAVELLETPDATVYDHLGDLYAALRQPEKAIEAWRKSLSVESNEEVRKKVESSEKK